MTKVVKKKELDNLTLHYFFEQKILEILCLIAIIIFGFSIFYALPVAIGMSIGDGYSGMCSGELVEGNYILGYKCTLSEIWMEGITYIMLSLGILYFISQWFKSNWDKAKERAGRELLSKLKKRGNKI